MERLVTVGGLCAALWFGLAMVACQPTSTAPVLTEATPQAATDAIHVAGAAEATPLLRYLARTFSAREPGAPLVVDDALGSEGGLSALAAGLLTGALVVTSSTDTRPQDAILLARSEVVIAMGPGIPTRVLDMKELIATINGEQSTWSSGLARRFLMGASENPASRALVAGFKSLGTALSQAGSARRWPRAPAGETVGGVVGRTPGSLAIADLGNLRLRSSPVWISRIAGDVPVFIDILLVGVAKAPPRLHAFIEFVRSSEGQGLVTDLGFVGGGSQ